MKLFATLYLDQDVSVQLARILVGRGFDVITTRDAGNLDTEDDEQLAFAVRQGRAILTHNRDHFTRLHEEYLEQGRHHHGILIAGQRPVYQIARRVQALLNTLTADELEKQILHV
jgi:predicted nuclease of predicted toxin-antitoxin system